MDLKLLEGRYRSRFFKTYIESGEEVITPLTLQHSCSVMLEMAQAVIQHVERNTKEKIIEMTLMFLQDFEGELWLMGSKEIKVISGHAFR